MNSVILVGRLTSDPRITVSQSGTKVASFRLAVDRETKDKDADFIQCKAFGHTAEYLENYKGKGDEVVVQGRIQTGSYKNREGATVYTTDVIANRVEGTHGSNREPKSQADKSEGFVPTNGFDEPAPKMFDGGLPDSFALAEEDLPF